MQKNPTRGWGGRGQARLVCASEMGSPQSATGKKALRVCTAQLEKSQAEGEYKRAPSTMTHAKTSARVCGLQARPIEEGGGHNVPSFVAREGRVDPLGDRARRGTLTKPLAHGSDSGVRGGTCPVCCCHAAASSRARGSAAYSSIDRRAGSVRLDSSAQRNLQQCKQGDAQRDAMDTERRLELTNTSLKPRPQ